MKVSVKITLVLVFSIVISIVISKIRPEIVNSRLGYDAFWTRKVMLNKKYPIIIYGDSRVYRGITPDSLKINDLDAINLGFSSGGLNKLMFDYIEHNLDYNSKIKIVLLGVSPYSLTLEARKNEQFVKEMNKSREVKLENLFKYKYLSFFEPIDVNNTFINPSKSKYYNHYYLNGWDAAYKIPFDSTEALSTYKELLPETKIDSLSIAEMLEFVERMSKNKVLVFGFRPPTTKAMYELKNKLLHFDEDYIKLKFEEKGGKWIEITNRFKYLVYDGSHLDIHSANRLSSYIKQYIEKELN